MSKLGLKRADVRIFGGGHNHSVYIVISMLDHLDGLNKSFIHIMSLKVSGLPVTSRAWAEIASEHRLYSFNFEQWAILVLRAGSDLDLTGTV